MKSLGFHELLNYHNVMGGIEFLKLNKATALTSFPPKQGLSLPRSTADSPWGLPSAVGGAEQHPTSPLAQAESTPVGRSSISPVAPTAPC